MNKRKLLVGLNAMLAALIVVGVALAQVSQSYELSWHNIASGGGARDSTNFLIEDTIGLTTVDSSASANYRIESGFWLTGASHVTGEERIYLPLTLRKIPDAKTNLQPW